MNFFSHDFILDEGAHPLMRLSTALPDLWSRLPQRPLPFRILPQLRAQDTEEARAVADGIESHLLADEAFHGHPDFHARMDRVEADLLAFWPEVEHGEMAAHILVEMLLDRWLILAHPERLASYYDCHSPAGIDTVARLGTTTEASREVLASVLNFLARERFLEDYVRPDGLAMRFSRAWARTPFAGETPVPVDALARWVAERHDAYVPGSEVLVEASRQAVKAGLGRPRVERASVVVAAP